jgi:hypothetical protein
MVCSVFGEKPGPSSALTRGRSKLFIELLQLAQPRPGERGVISDSKKSIHSNSGPGETGPLSIS